MDLDDYQRVAALAQDDPSLTSGIVGSPLVASDTSSDTDMNDSLNTSDEQTKATESICNNTEHSDSNIFDTQLILTTQGSNLVLHDFSLENDTKITRRRLDSDNIYHEYFCILDVPTLPPPNLEVFQSDGGKLDRSINVNDIRCISLPNSMDPSNGIFPRHEHLRFNP